MDMIPQHNTPCKLCTNPACQKCLPATLDFFYTSKLNRDGLSSRCKECLRSYGLTRYHQNPEVRERVKVRDKSRLAQRREYLKRPEVRAKRCESARVRNAQKKSIKGRCTPEQILDLLKRQKYKCYYCSAKFEKRDGKYIYHTDHTFPVSRVAGSDIPANDISYIVLTCPACNQSKHNRFPWEWPEGGRLL